MKKIALLFSAFLYASISFSEVRLPSVLGSNMVMQQKAANKLWGWCFPGEKIYVTTSWDNKTDSVIGTENANWQITVQTPVAGGPYSITFRGSNTVTIDNIMIGEVWVCSGQSNMEMHEGWGLPDVKAELPNSANSKIRFFFIPKTSSPFPQDDCVGKWVECDSNSLRSFSAAGYFFGKKLNNTLNVPVGLIDASWGGTPAEVWTPAELVMNNDTLKAAAGKLEPTDGWPIKPGYTYNAMIAPLTRLDIAGVIWYQGESNANTASTYNLLFTTMIEGWRKKWNKDFPFYYVQIAPYKYENNNVAALLREAQTKTLALQGVGMAVITDLVDDTNDIHPKNKHDVGYRLANWALAKTYGADSIVYKSPIFRNMEIKNGKAIISFEDPEKGLKSAGKKITEIFIAGEDKIFYPAEAKIDNRQLLVWSRKVKNPVAVRYAFANTAIGNLFNLAGLPVTPFRTDNWEVDTSPIK